MTRWFIGSRERYAQILDTNGTPSAVYNNQLQPTPSAQFYCAWSPDGGTTIYLGGRHWSTDSATLWKSIDGGSNWSDVAGDASTPSVELPAGYHGDNSRFKSMHGYSDGVFYANVQHTVSDAVLKYDNGTWTAVHLDTNPDKGPQQIHENVNGHVLATRTGSWLNVYNGTYWGWDNTWNSGTLDTQSIACWYIASLSQWFVMSMSFKVYKGTPYSPTFSGDFGAGSWSLDKDIGTDLGGVRLVDTGNPFWGDSSGNLYTIFDTGNNCEIYMRDVALGTWSSVYTLSGVDNIAGGIYGTGNEVLAGGSSASSEYFAHKSQAGVWSLINASTSFGWQSDVGQGIWASGSESIPPVINNPNPVNNETDVDVSTSLSADITDSGSGVDADTTVITVAGVTAWINDAAANGWSGSRTVIPSGFRYSVSPPIEFNYETTVPWSVTADDDDGNTALVYLSFVTGEATLGILGHQLEVGPVIGSGVLTYTTPTSPARTEAGEEAYPAAIGSYSAFTTTAHPSAKRLIKGWQWDKRTWSDDDNDNVVMTVPSNYDPSTSGITQTHFQSGIGSNRDLELVDIKSLPSSGLNTVGVNHVWAPELWHGYYYDYEEEGYLFSDDSEIETFTYSGVVLGLGYDTVSGFNTVTLSSRTKVGAPVQVTQYEWNSTEGRYDLSLNLRKKVEFSGTRDENLARQDTYDTTSGRISWDLIDRDEEEFIITYSGTTPQIILNNQYVEEVGAGLMASGLEFVGYSTGETGQQFHTQYAPIDSSMPMEVWSYTTVGSGELWEVVDAGTTPSGLQVAVDYDLGTLEFGDPAVSGQDVPGGGLTIGTRYWKTVRVEYEPEQSADTITATETSVNPIYRSSPRGFVYLSTRLEDPVSIELSASLSLIQTDTYGPLFIGNTFAPIIATVKDSRGQELEGQTVSFFITSEPETGAFGASSTTTAVTDQFGEARAYYNPPRGVNDIGENITASGWSVEDSPTDPVYSGLGQITTLRTQNLLLEGDLDDIFLYQVQVDDPLQGYFDPELEDDYDTQISGYYTEFFQEHEIFGPVGMDPTSSGALDFAIDWEENRRLLWDLSRPSIFTANAGAGRKVLVAAYDADMLNPHTFAAGAVGPVQPVNVSAAGGGEYDVVFDTTANSIPQPTASLGVAPSGILHSYFLVAPTTVRIQASVFNSRLNRHILSNEISVKLDIPPYMNGLWVLDAINDSHIDEINTILASGITASGQKVPLGFRLRSSRVTLAAALDGVTFLDVNTPTSSGIGHQLRVGSIFG